MKVFFCGFLNSGAKKIKKQHQLVELGFDRSLVVGAFNALIDYCYFNQTLTRGRPGRKIPQSEKKDYWKRERERERVFCTLQPELDMAKGTG